MSTKTQVDNILDRFGMDSFQSKTNLLAILFIIPPVLFLLVVMVLPMIFTLGLSLQDVTIFSTDASFIGVENYMTLYKSPDFWHSVGLGLVFAVASVILQIILGISFAVVLNRDFFGSMWARTFAILPYLVPTIVMAFMWRWMLSGTIGIVNLYSVHFGLIEEPIPFLQSAELAMPSVITINGWKFTSFAMLIFLARLQSIDENMYEQAKINGASALQMFRDITLPHLMPAIMLVGLIRFVWMFNKFDTIWLLTGGGPLESTTTLPIHIYELTFNQYELGLGAAAAINMFLLLSAIAVAYFWLLDPSEEIQTRR